MKVLYGYSDRRRAFGLAWEKQTGYRHAVLVEFWRCQWVFEFGRGDAYDWEDAA